VNDLKSIGFRDNLAYESNKGQENDVSIHKAVYSNYARDLVIKRPAADVTVFLSTTKERKEKEKESTTPYMSW
jgi:hypothetical protein